MNEESAKPRLQHEHREESEVEARVSNNEESEFKTPEEMLRRDAENTPTPPGLEPRVRQSLASEPVVKTPWWRKWLGKS